MKERELQNSNERKVKEFQVVKAIDLIEKVKKEPEPKLIWKGIPERSSGLIAGKGKTGKTTFAENLAISLSVGRKEFFGQSLKGKPQKVLFINLEESYRLRSRRNIKQISTLSNQELKLFSENYISTPENFLEYIDSENDWEQVHNYILKVNPDVLFIDSLTHLCSGEIEKSVVANNFVKNFRKYITSLGKTVVVIHHNVKGNEKPIDQDSIAGSRIISQEFQYAYGFSEIPTAQGGHYMCSLFNKHIESDSTTANLYKMNGTGWVEFIGIENKFNLYKPGGSSIDRRKDSSNTDKLYNYFVSQSGQDSPTTISANTLKKEFVETSTMSKDTLYRQLGNLVDEGKLLKPQKATYKLNTNNEEGNGEKLQ